MEVRAVGQSGVSSVAFLALENLLILIWIGGTGAAEHEQSLNRHDHQVEDKDTYFSHSCIHGEILHQRRRPGIKEYSITLQVYEESDSSPTVHHGGRTLLGLSVSLSVQKDIRQPIRIYLNYDAVGHSPDRDYRSIGDIVMLSKPPASVVSETLVCNPHGDPPMFGDCWYNCTFEDIAGEDKKQRPHKLSGYSACGQDGGVQLPHEYVEDGVANADLVLLVTTRPTTGNTLAWAVACERDQWGRAIAGHVNVAPHHLTAEAETVLSATLIHEVMHVLGFDPHAFSHFCGERKRRRSQLYCAVD